MLHIVHCKTVYFMYSQIRAEGNVLNISAVDASRYVCVVDVPLKRLCTAEQVDLFKFSGMKLFHKVTRITYTCTHGFLQ